MRCKPQARPALPAASRLHHAAPNLRLKAIAVVVGQDPSRCLCAQLVAAPQLRWLSPTQEAQWLQLPPF